MHLEKFSLNFSSSSFEIRFNRVHPRPSTFLFGLFLPIWCLSTPANYYFKVALLLKESFYVVKMTPIIVTSRFVHLEKFSLNFSSSSFAIRFNRVYPRPSTFLFGLFLPIWCLSTPANYYFKVALLLKESFYVVKTDDSKYRDVAPLTKLSKIAEPLLVCPTMESLLSDYLRS